MAMPVGLYTVTLETIEFNKSRYCADNKFVFMYQEEEKAKIIKKNFGKLEPHYVIICLNQLQQNLLHTTVTKQKKS